MYLYKHQWKCRVSTMFIHLILVTLLITNGCNITVYLLYLSHQPVYPIQFIQQQLVYFQCVYYAPFTPVVCTLQTILFREYRSLSTSKVSCSICHHYCWLSCFVFSQYVLISVDIYNVPVLFPCVMAINWLNLKTWIGSDDDLAGAKPLWEPFMVSLLAHICVTWPHWVKNKLLAWHESAILPRWFLCSKREAPMKRNEICSTSRPRTHFFSIIDVHGAWWQGPISLTWVDLNTSMYMLLHSL